MKIGIGLAYMVGTEEDITNLEANVATYLETKNEFLLESIFGGVIKFIHTTRNKFYFIDFNDYYSDANLVMFKALDTYDSSKGTKFMTHYGNILYRTLSKRIRDSFAQKRAKDREVISLNYKVKDLEDDALTLEDALASDADIFNTVYANYIVEDIDKSQNFSNKEKDLFRYKYLEDFTLQDIVDKELYASRQTASRASIKLSKKLKLFYGGC